MHQVMVITGESVEERKERLSEEAERAGVQAHAPDVVRIADDEDTEDDEAFKEPELLRKAQEKIHAKHMDRLARVKIDCYGWLGSQAASQAVRLQVSQEQATNGGMASSCASP